MSAEKIGGFTRTDRSAGGTGSAEAASAPRPLPEPQMDLIKGVFAPEQMR
jgi:hypothetical protein